MKTIKLIVKGNVQSVAFRYYAKQSAEKLGIKGTLKNGDDGSVEIIGYGDEENLKTFESYLLKCSVHSRIDQIESTAINSSKVFEDFSFII